LRSADRPELRKRPTSLKRWQAGDARRNMKREVIQPHSNDKRYIRRDKEGQFTEKQVNVGKSLSADRRSKSKTIVPKGQGDRGDQKRS